jgi:hypothetical protein
MISERADGFGIEFDFAFTAFGLWRFHFDTVCGHYQGLDHRQASIVQIHIPPL